MNKFLIAMGLLMLASNGAAYAQGRNSSGMNSNSDRPTIQAPVGHRQPRAGDVPSEKNLSNPNEPVNKEDAELDRKIKSICRGC
jgi:hypothetical protein